MLPSLYYVYEEVTPQQPLNSLIGLDFAETNLLAELNAQARYLAPKLGKSLIIRIQEFFGNHAGYPISSSEMQLYLQDWFLQLFQCREENFLRFEEYYQSIPLNLIITGIDVILAYGLEVAQFSLEPQKATRAFHKALALKITSELLQLKADETQHFTEMILLD